MSPLERYQRDIVQHNFQRDTAQEAAILHLQRLYDDLLTAASQSLSDRVTAHLKALFRRKNRPFIKGLYLWGGVGRGKTYLMDTFYETLPFEHRIRTHFHRFMRRVHRELKQLEDQADPLVRVADTLAKEARVICFDEFFVVDIADAMILAGLLQALFDRGVVLVATSNIEPDYLYHDGLQRARFTPAIELLNQRTVVVNVDGGVDYRLRTLEQAKLFHTPLDEHAQRALEAFFTNLIPDRDAICANVDIEVEGRAIRAVKEAEDVVWFDFASLCDGPRSPNDYIELAREYHAVIVANVPVLHSQHNDQARRFIYLVDEFYDRNVKLILSAARPVHELYQGGRLQFEFERTVSRIREMQSHEYLARGHRA